MHDDPVIVARAIEGGAQGFVLKDTAVTDFHEALEAVRAGQSYLPHGVATQIAMLNAGLLESPFARLSAREVQVLSLLGEGKTSEAIADSLSLSHRSVSATLSGMKRKLGAGSLAHLLHIAVSRAGGPEWGPPTAAPAGSSAIRSARSDRR
jgi:DNA-binding NarL/FixJ family response regulator